MNRLGEEIPPGDPDEHFATKQISVGIHMILDTAVNE